MSKSAGGSFEGEVSILTNTDERHVNLMLRDNLIEPVTFCLGYVCFPIQKMHRSGRTTSTRRSRRYLRKLAGCVSGMPMYSSRWNIIVLLQSIASSAVSAAKKSNCEAPVATMKLACPFASNASRSFLLARCAAASLVSRLVVALNIFIRLKFS